MCGRWWRTMTATTPEEAQVSLDRFWAATGDARLRPPGRYIDADGLVDGERRSWPTVGELANAERLMALPAAPYPATIEVRRHRLAPPGAGSMVRTPEHRAALEAVVLSFQASLTLVSPGGSRVAPGVGFSRTPSTRRSAVRGRSSRRSGSAGRPGRSAAP
jgi:hypothetical protein